MPTAVDCEMALTAQSAEVLRSRHEVAKEIVQTLARQLPPHDFDGRHCSSLRDDVEQRTMKEFVEFRIKSALGQGSVSHCRDEETQCYQCTRSILPGQLTVTAGRAGEKSRWHIDCFVCSCCHERLVQHVYFWSSKEGQVYCGRHHAEMLRPRCAACDEIIFSDQCTEADGRFWHVEHFRCTECRLPLAGKRYVFAEDEHDISQPYCFKCYHAVLANFCRTCGRLVEAGQRHVTLSGTGSWHADGDCFRCDCCRQSLVGRPFVLSDWSSDSGSSTPDGCQGNELFCSEECCDRQAGSNLAADEIVRRYESVDRPGDDDFTRSSSTSEHVRPISFGGDIGTLRRKCVVTNDILREHLVGPIKSQRSTERSRGDVKRRRSKTNSKLTTTTDVIHASGFLQPDALMRRADDNLTAVGVEFTSVEAANSACKVTCV